MKYYKLIEKEGYNHFKTGKIYKDSDTIDISDTVSYCVKNYPSDWQEVHPSEYFVQEGKMPEYFAIKRVAGNPLWGKYINWLNRTYKKNWGGIYNKYYGYDGSTEDNGIAIYYFLSNFQNNPVELTLEQWNKIINKTMKENDKEIVGWKLKDDCKKNSKTAFYICTGYTNDNGIYGSVESSHDIEKLKEAGVLELWFEPVYKEKTLQFGGYDVTFEKVTSGVRITCNGETGTLSQIEKIYSTVLKEENMMFGSQEVKQIDFSDGSYYWSSESLKAKPTSIKIGCTTGTWKEFIAIYEKAKSML